VNRFRTLAVVLALTSLTACGSEDDTTATAPPVAASSTASAPAPATSATSAGTATEAPPEAGTRGGVDTAALCKEADEAKKILVTVFAEALGGGEPDPAKVQKAVADLGAKLTAIGTKGGSSEAGVAMQEYGAELTKASKEADPFEASNSAASEKAGERVDAACAKA
jgi:hypothetical protein